MAMKLALLFAIVLAFDGSSALEVASADSLAGPRPIRKVITLLEEMKATVEKEAKDDEASYNKYKCWAETEAKRASDAVDSNTANIDELTAFIEEGTATAAKLETEIKQLTKQIAEAEEAIAEATRIREKEKEAFLAAEADMKETVESLYQAVDVLQKVQLVQTKGKPAHSDQRVLLQLENVRTVLSRHFPDFRSTMQKDLFDMLAAIKSPKDVLRSKAAALAQARAQLLPGRELLPWEKSAEQIGKEEKPNDLKGMAAGAKSYNARSGQILGILKEMLDEFSRDLAEAQKADLMAEVAFQNLNAAKLAEIAAATKMKEAKEEQLKVLLRKLAQAKEDLEVYKEAVANDEKFLGDVDELLKRETADYEKRVKERSLEIVALAETLKILTQDDARDLYASSSLNFFQLNSNLESHTAMQERLTEKAMQRIAKVAKAHKNWALAGLAVRVRLDGFEKVKEMMDKMLAELKKQQAEEYTKWEFCKEEIDKTEDEIKVKNNEKEDLATLHKQLVSTLEKLNSEIEELKAEVAATEVSLKQAGEQRKEENQLFQTSVADQRACINILEKALKRLQDFYTPALVQGRPAREALRKSGWSGAGEMAAEPEDYEKNSDSGGAMQMLQKIIGDAKAVEGELMVDENNAQEEYAKAAQDMTDLILADREAIASKEAKVAETEAKKAETEEAQLANEKELMSLKKLLMAHHAECDYIIKYFDIRQTARQQEMEAIEDAKAILSGAKFS